VFVAWPVLGQAEGKIPQIGGDGEKDDPKWLRVNKRAPFTMENVCPGYLADT